MAILPPERYDDIRAAVDPMLAPEALPAEVIASSIYLGRAEAWITALDPLAPTRVGAELEHVHEAIVLQTASYLSVVVPQTRQANMAGHSATFLYAEDPTTRSARLQNDAFSHVLAYLPSLAPDIAVTAPIFITTVSGQRG
jgi:hypothetical protein